MKILYLSCHAILEYDEIRMFVDMGHEVFSTGAYIHNNPSSRPKIQSMKINEDWMYMWDNMPIKNQNIGKNVQLTKQFVDNFDIVYIMHNPDFLTKNWENINHKRVIWRSIGQSSVDVENIIKKYKNNIKIIRYSERELLLPNSQGFDRIIRFSKRPNEFPKWEGTIKEMVSVCQSMAERGEHCNWKLFSLLSKKIPCKLFGHDNKGADSLWNGRNCTWEELLNVYKNYCVFFYGGTKPASYTLSFMEAMLTGIPIISVGEKLGNWSWWPAKTFEIPHIITNGVDGFISDDAEEICEYYKFLINNKNHSDNISNNSRKKAIDLFDENRNRIIWEHFFNKL